MLPFFCMVSSKSPAFAVVDEAVAGQHDAEVCDKHDDRDGGSEGPVQLLEVLVVYQGRRHLQATATQESWNGEGTGRQPKDDEAAGEHTECHLRHDYPAKSREVGGAEGPGR